MFCRLFECKEITGLDFGYSLETCQNICSAYADGCTITDEYNKQLSKDKFGWRINIRIMFKEPSQPKQGGTYTNIIQLIHPSNDDLWVCKGLKKDQETVIYFLCYDGKQREHHKTLEDLNRAINGKYYEGRDLVESDFGDNNV